MDLASLRSVAEIGMGGPKTYLPAHMSLFYITITIVTPTKYLSDAYLVISHCGSNSNLVVQPSIWFIPIDMVYMSLVVDCTSGRLPS